MVTETANELVQFTELLGANFLYTEPRNDSREIQ